PPWYLQPGVCPMPPRSEAHRADAQLANIVSLSAAVILLFVTGLLNIVTILYFSLEHHYLCFFTTESHNAAAGLRIAVAIWIILITKESHVSFNPY
ncbi:MAG: hypothetical protein ACYCSZ_05345, partial [Burkholderiales bacterium]